MRTVEGSSPAARRVEASPSHGASQVVHGHPTGLERAGRRPFVSVVRLDALVGQLEGILDLIGHPRARRHHFVRRDAEVGGVGHHQLVEGGGVLDDGLVTTLAHLADHLGHGVMDVGTGIVGARQDLLEGRRVAA